MIPPVCGHLTVVTFHVYAVLNLFFEVCLGQMSEKNFRVVPAFFPKDRIKEVKKSSYPAIPAI
jgi:hypothetical protein